MIVTLSWPEVFDAAMAGVRRRVVSVKDRRIDRHGYNGLNAWGIDISGALGEFAVAKALNLFWRPGINTFKLPDVGALYVRTTGEPNGRLIIRKTDPAGVYVLVIDHMPRLKVAGWMSKEEAQQKEYETRPDPTRPACWAAPQSKLHSIEELTHVATEKRLDV